MNYKKQKEQRNNYREELRQRCVSIRHLYLQAYKAGDPISKIIPNYWNVIEYRAIKDVLFTRVKIRNSALAVSIGAYTWILNMNFYDHIDTIVTKVMQRVDELRYIISKKNRRTVPQSLFVNQSLTFKFHTESKAGFELISWPEFRTKYTRELEDEELVRSIYTAIEESFAAGVRVGQNDPIKIENDKNSLIDIHDNIEEALANLKKLIDKE